MSNITQTAEVDVFMNGEQAKNEMNRLQAEAKRLQTELVELRKKSKQSGEDLSEDIKKVEKEYKETQKSIKALQTSMQNIREAMGQLDKLTPKELQKTIKTITREMNSGRIQRGSAQWDYLTRALRRVKEEASKLKEEMSETRSLSDRFSEWGNKWMGIVMTIDGGLQAISGMKSTMQDSVQAYADMQEAESQVIKYTGMTKEEVQDLNEEFKKMDTRTPRERLNALAGDAGRLGITSRDGILEFVDAADKINVALGEDLGEDAVKNIGKLAQMFDEDKTKGLRGAMLATGSAINEVAQNSSAAEAYLVDFTARVAGAAKQANISQADIIGYASVLDENMLRDETAATAFQNVMMKMFQQPELFAKIARINTAEFTKTMKEDANKAMLQFLQSLSDRGNLAELAPIFDKMKLDGQGAASVLAVMAGKIDDVRARQELANKAYQDATSIVNEFNVQNNTVQAQLDKNVNKFNDLKEELGEELLPVMSSGISLTTMGIEVLITLIKFVSEHKVTLAMTTSAILLYTAAVNASIIADKLKVLWNNKIITSFKMLKTALMNNPYGILAVAVATAVGYMYDLYKSQNKVVSNADKLNDLMKDANSQVSQQRNEVTRLVKIAKDEANSLDLRKKAIEKLNEIAPDYLGNLKLENINTSNADKAIQKYTASLLANAKAKAISAKLEEVQKKKMELQNNSSDSYRWYDPFVTGAANMANYALKAGQAIGSAIQYGTFSGWQDSTSLEKRGTSFSTVETTVRRQRAAMQELQDEESFLMKALEELTKTELSLETDATGGKGGGSIGEDLKDDEIRRKKINQINDMSQKQRLAEKLQYSSGIIDYTTYQDRIYEIDKDNIKKRLALYKSHESEYGTIQKELIKLDEDRQKEKTDWSLQQIDQETQTKQAALEIQHASGKLSEAAYQDELDNIELDGLKRRAEYLRKWGNPEEANKAEEQYQQTVEEKKTARQVKFLEQVKQLQDKYLKSSAEEQMQFQLDTLDQMHEAGLLAEEDYQRMLAIIRFQGAQDVKEESKSKTNQILSDVGYKPQEVTGSSDPLSGAIISMGQWVSTQKQNETALQKIKEMEQAGVITHQEAANAIADIDKNRFESYVAGAQAAYGVVNALMSSASDFIQASMNAEVSAIEERYDAEIERAGNNSTQVSKLEDKKEAEIAKVKNKYNKKAMAIEISQAVASTAMAAINAYASAAAVPVVGYILGPIAAAAALAAGALQIATIKKQHEAQSKGYYSGGFTGKGPRRQVAGLVHSDEFVVNAEGVNNPNVRPILHFLDQAQKNNTIGSLTAADVSRVVTAPVVSSTASQNTAETTIQMANDPETKDILSRLDKKLGQPITANVVIDGEDGFDAQYSRYQKLIKRK